MQGDMGSMNGQYGRACAFRNCQIARQLLLDGFSLATPESVRANQYSVPVGLLGVRVRILAGMIQKCGHESPVRILALFVCGTRISQPHRQQIEPQHCQDIQPGKNTDPPTY